MAQGPFDRFRDRGSDLDLWWAVPGVLAGMPMPRIHPERRENFGGSLNAYHDALPLLAEAGIGAVVSLLNIPSDERVYQRAGFAYHLLPIPDGAAPSVDQFLDFLNFMREQRAANRVVAVHCAAGLGRTGTMLAAYLIAKGTPVDEAVAQIRKARPGAIETPAQMRFLRDLASGAGAR